MTKKRNIVIIGAGHNGLICAAYLAKAGHEVTVLEARDQIGGGIAPREFSKGFTAPGLAHLAYPLHPKIISDLEIGNNARSKSRTINTISLSKSGDHLHLGQSSASGGSLSSEDQEAYSAFKKEFLAYAKALSPLMMNKPPRLKNMDTKDKITLAKLGWKVRFGLKTDSMREFLRVGGINIYDVLNEVFDSEALKGAIAADAVIGHHMAPRTPTTVLTYILRLFGETENRQLTSAVPNICEALATAATSAGVNIRTQSKVEDILLSDDQVTGVRLSNVEEISADIVVSNSDAKSTFLDLVGVQDLDAMFVHRISKSRTNGDVAKLHFALKSLPNFTSLDAESLRHRLLIAPNMRYIEQAFNPSKYGEFSERPVLEITFPTIDNPALSPDGQHTMSVNASFAPYALKAGWDKKRKTFTQKVIDTVAGYAPGFESLILDHELLTPVDIESEYNIKGGHWHHGEIAIDQSFMMRPIHGTAQYNTPISGLFLCGAAAHPGGSINGLPGRNAAQRILAMTKSGDV